MSKVVATNVIPDDASNDLLTIGAASDAVAVNDSLNVDTLQDMGGNTIFVSDGSGTITSKNSGFPGSLQLISTQTASGSTNIAFTSGIDSTYDVYCFKFIDLNPVTDDAVFAFQVNADGGSGFNETITSTAFRARHTSNDATAELGYNSGSDQAQGTAYQHALPYIGNGADECGVGEMYLFAPSSTTYVKHFYIVGNNRDSSGSYQNFIAGYINTTSAIDEIDFKMTSGNFDGTIKLYGISKS